MKLHTFQGKFSTGLRHSMGVVERSGIRVARQALAGLLTLSMGLFPAIPVHADNGGSIAVSFVQSQNNDQTLTPSTYRQTTLGPAVDPGINATIAAANVNAVQQNLGDLNKHALTNQQQQLSVPLAEGTGTKANAFALVTPQQAVGGNTQTVGGTGDTSQFPGRTGPNNTFAPPLTSTIGGSGQGSSWAQAIAQFMPSYLQAKTQEEQTTLQKAQMEANKPAGPINAFLVVDGSGIGAFADPKDPEKLIPQGGCTQQQMLAGQCEVSSPSGRAKFTVIPSGAPDSKAQKGKGGKGKKSNAMDVANWRQVQLKDGPISGSYTDKDKIVQKIVSTIVDNYLGNVKDPVSGETKKFGDRYPDLNYTINFAGGKVAEIKAEDARKNTWTWTVVGHTKTTIPLPPQWGGSVTANLPNVELTDIKQGEDAYTRILDKDISAGKYQNVDLNVAKILYSHTSKRELDNEALFFDSKNNRNIFAVSQLDLSGVSEKNQVVYAAPSLQIEKTGVNYKNQDGSDTVPVYHARTGDKIDYPLKDASADWQKDDLFKDKGVDGLSFMMQEKDKTLTPFKATKDGKDWTLDLGYNKALLVGKDGGFYSKFKKEDEKDAPSDLVHFMNIGKAPDASKVEVPTDKKSAKQNDVYDDTMKQWVPEFANTKEPSSGTDINLSLDLAHLTDKDGARYNGESYNVPLALRLTSNPTTIDTANNVIDDKSASFDGTKNLTPLIGYWGDTTKMVYRFGHPTGAQGNTSESDLNKKTGQMIQNEPGLSGQGKNKSGEPDHVTYDKPEGIPTAAYALGQTYTLKKCPVDPSATVNNTSLKHDQPVDVYLTPFKGTVTAQYQNKQIPGFPKGYYFQPGTSTFGPVTYVAGKAKLQTGPAMAIDMQSNGVHLGTIEYDAVYSTPTKPGQMRRLIRVDMVESNNVATMPGFVPPNGNRMKIYFSPTLP